MLYVLRADCTEHRTKIGITKGYHTLKRRLSNIKTGCPFQVEVYALFPNEGRELEDKIKAYFKGRFNQGTEWVIADVGEVLRVTIEIIGEMRWTIQNGSNINYSPSTR